jgi:hypothetical protein
MSFHRVILLERRLPLTRVLYGNRACSGRTKRLFHRKSIATIDAIEHVLNVANSNLAYNDDGLAARHVGIIPHGCHFGKLWASWRKIRDASVTLRG